ncbi:MAG: ADP-glyceromanno-heptose 6-epimerase [Bacteroidales bacterium]|nr:ADP-glyceromanno-heptose 6-epimerase [Bacteroidales bacterium]
MPIILVTGAAGFIASNVVAALNTEGLHDLVLSDDFSRKDKIPNWEGKRFAKHIPRNILPTWLDQHHKEIGFVIHLGARTDTTETRWDIFQELNLGYTEKLWGICCRHQIPLIYASSAATYGDGTQGYHDNHAVVPQLKPLNAYGRSKNGFDKWALRQAETGRQPPFWAGLKFFNVYGPNEYHKGRMASVILHTFESVRSTGHMNLFRSHRADFADGMQLRDFVYVKDVANVIFWLMKNRPESGLYNVGTGHAQSFIDLANATFAAMEKQPNISFVDIPKDIRDKYQYFTEADIRKLRKAGYDKAFHSLADGVNDYVRNYLTEHKYA